MIEFFLGDRGQPALAHERLHLDGLTLQKDIFDEFEICVET